MAQEAIPQSAKEDQQHLISLESPIMDAWWAVECAYHMVEDEMQGLFNQIKATNGEVEKVYFSRRQAERIVWMMGMASDCLETLKTAYYGETE